MISVYFQGKPFNNTIIQLYAPTTDAKEAEVEQFYEDLQDILELAPKKKKKRLECKSRKSRESRIGKFGLGVQSEAVHVLSHSSHVRLLATLSSVACQALLSIGILHTRTLEWVAMPSSRRSSLRRDQTCLPYISCTDRQFLYH